MLLLPAALALLLAAAHTAGAASTADLAAQVLRTVNNSTTANGGNTAAAVAALANDPTVRAAAASVLSTGPQRAYLVGFTSQCQQAAATAVDTIRPALASVNVTVDWAFDVHGVKGVKVRYAGPALPLGLVQAKVPCVAYIEEDTPLAVTETAAVANGGAIVENACLQSTAMAGKQSLWGLDAMDGSLDGKYALNLTGAGVNVYVIDSGIRADHAEFSGRAQNIYTAQGAQDPNLTPTTDCTGHGTHVSGVAVGHTVGIAKGANVYGLRIIGCDKSGSVSDAVDALNYLAKNLKKPAVINMSLGSPEGLKGNTLPNAITALVKQGVHVVIAAGNSAVDACSAAAGAPSLTTIADTYVVGAVDRPSATDLAQNIYNPRVATFSNTGACVKYWAPGVDIWSASNFSADATNDPKAFESRQGTSQATPFVTGVIALHLEMNASFTPADLTQVLLTRGKPMSWGGVHVVAPTASNGANASAGNPAKALTTNSLSTLSFPLAACSTSDTGVTGAIKAALGTSNNTVYLIAGAAGAAVLVAVVAGLVVRHHRRRSTASANAAAAAVVPKPNPATQQANTQSQRPPLGPDPRRMQQQQQQPPSAPVPPQPQPPQAAYRPTTQYGASPPSPHGPYGPTPPSPQGPYGASPPQTQPYAAPPPARYASSPPQPLGPMSGPPPGPFPPQQQHYGAPPPQQPHPQSQFYGNAPGLMQQPYFDGAPGPRAHPSMAPMQQQQPYGNAPYGSSPPSGGMYGR
ncbi:hypothetical protein GGF32_008681 [Allomyces javanicus]|nr:hypothetical protein GGF32_008681 [Allomyces javanicus]